MMEYAKLAAMIVVGLAIGYSLPRPGEPKEEFAALMRCERATLGTEVVWFDMYYDDKDGFSANCSEALVKKNEDGFSETTHVHLFSEGRLSRGTPLRPR
jgi:hypothetical protein